MTFDRVLCLHYSMTMLGEYVNLLDFRIVRRKSKGAGTVASGRIDRNAECIQAMVFIHI